VAGPGDLSSVFSGSVLKPGPENAKDSHPAPKTFPWGKGDRREAVVDEGLTSAKRKSESEAFLIPTPFPALPGSFRKRKERPHPSALRASTFPQGKVFTCPRAPY